MMLPDDPRHSTYAGYNAGCRLDCCRTAARNYQKRRLYEAQPRTVPSLGVRRRIQALACLGWSMYDVATRAGLARENVRQWTLHDLVHRTTHDLVAKIYDELSMQLPPQDTLGQRQTVTKTRNRAAARGWLPPLAYDDIDDPTERGSRGPTARPTSSVDETVVLRVLGGEHLPTTKAEKRIIMARWLAQGGSENVLCDRMGWRAGRYANAPKQQLGETA